RSEESKNQPQPLSIPQQIMQTLCNPGPQTLRVCSTSESTPAQEQPGASHQSVRRRIRITFRRARTARWWLRSAIQSSKFKVQSSKFLLFFLLWTLDFGHWTCPASTITGTIQNTSGNAYATN